MRSLWTGTVTCMLLTGANPAVAAGIPFEGVTSSENVEVLSLSRSSSIAAEEKDPLKASLLTLGVPLGIAAISFGTLMLLRNPSSPTLDYPFLYGTLVVAPLGLSAGHLYLGDAPRGTMIGLGGSLIGLGSAILFETSGRGRLFGLLLTPVVAASLLGYTGWAVIDTHSGAWREKQSIEGPSPREAR